ncbi:exopolysaccharide biosynthesis polyprenyl glycosylphosphotransferase [Roseomonas terrae]|uniref:Exopolysaccharide biosynthesis polyprenyl glycosylphosphotransferase n=1 Tax=Neoroseomonas terrae TaxID=424799 RepID=A0ABS5EJ49_9PROT|nr:exopolysaccharide biosynthesis polyprenyl glycosylphosphotransferase [Neoroseomonas terrae]MBR0651058.1 exopolysaccharide biosynthesis polyprenyl glycosylphosphotransferase [Neoroseomonas terrae]
MAERTGSMGGVARFLWVAAEAGAGLLSLLTASGLAPAIRFGMQADLWVGACMGTVHLLVTSRTPGLRDTGWQRQVVGVLLAGAVLLAASWFGRGAIDARSLGTALSAFVVFRVAAGVAGLVLATLADLQAGPALPLPRPATGFIQHFAVADTPRREAIMAMSGQTIRRGEVPAIGSGPGGPGLQNWLDMDSLPADWLDGSGALGETRSAAVVRRSFDILASGGLFLLTLPLLLLTALAIRLESRGPVLYRQERVGLNGRVFTLFKFRSMTVDAEAGGTAIWAVPQDPRVTRVGRFIRLTRIDEIPQVLNVLRGDMAFIGPRPERPVFVAQLERAIPRYADRATVRPGITGWAQVRYRYGASVEDARMKLGYDLYYIRHRSLALDLRILAATVRVVLLQEGSR